MFAGDGSHPLDRQFRVGSPFGIPLYLHIFLMIFVGFWTLTSLVPFNLVRILWPLVLVGSVYLHELGHALSSAYFGARPRRIVLHMFGGVAEVPPSLNSYQELWVIAWGPLVSLILAVIGYFGAMFTYSLSPFTAHLFTVVFQINAILFIFNILPIYPLDGGQFYREWQSNRLGKNAGIRKSLPLSMATLIAMGLLSMVLQWIGIFGLVIAIALALQNHTEYKHYAYLFTDGFWHHAWPFSKGPKRSKDRWPGEKEEASTRGGIGDQLYVKLNQKKAEKLMRKADEVGLFNLSPKERQILERYLDAKIGIKERNQKLN